MTPTEWTLGVLLGGGSHRMGQDKALLQVGHLSLVEHVVASCKRENQTVLLSVGKEGRQIPPALSTFPQFIDRLMGAGPLAGIEALVEACQDPWLVVVPCDMPGLTSNDLDLLVRKMSGEDDFGLFETSGRKQFLPLALRRDWVKDAIGKTLEGGFRRIVDLLQQGSGSHVSWDDPVKEPRTFHNVNTQGEFQAFLKEQTGRS